ncbi:phosphatidylserine decarboxylase [Blastomyces dermatitidis ER-3]|uniref:Phosphatidylserine decarboxylase proenzyme 2 n=2 Tax=Ajellomyces dermatitidis TaxID=5039 RepID=F2T6C4_AJEDA|nr:phosphatidylserine decarboxylase [Blastomyces dermatitidis ER-3]EEQ90919.2 phosphatidylserine decarboxylase [Blastomyces dermatitidis ER-3]EGE78738.1 phosphatidylserine decarboxylase [Blastomyces dermatitidis ATCC 18188]EQL36441.1 phosphatidylserine decarboxylase [Blastomyces dermatitidis ATCC 26199]
MVRISLPRRVGSHLSAKSNAMPPSGDLSPALTPSGTDTKPLILKATVISGRNLAPKDRNGLSDPYLVVSLGEARQSTPTITKTLNPEWNVSFDLPILGVPLLECICWDKDRFGKDYMGEFDIPLEDIFSAGTIQPQPQWYTLHSGRKAGRKSGDVSGEIQMQFTLFDPTNPSAEPNEILQKFKVLVSSDDEDEIIPVTSPDTDDLEKEDETTDGTDDPTKPDVVEKRRRKLRLARLKRKSIAARAYEFSGSKDGVSGIVFMEIVKILDLPPERNMTRTSFDMDPFVVTSLGKKTLRTRVIRHNLNPVFEEKMVFQVMKHEQSYCISFTVIDRDKLSGNDFVASSSFPLHTLTLAAPVADPETGLYNLPGPPSEPSPTPPATKSRFRLNLSRSSSATSLTKLAKPSLRTKSSATSLSSQSGQEQQSTTPPNVPSEASSQLNLPASGNMVEEPEVPADEYGLKTYIIPLVLKNKERWEDKHFPELHVKAKYMPYPALRQQFWRAMLKQYDADDSARISKVELTTMLGTLGSTLKESTIDGFFKRFAAENEPSETVDLTFDQAVICLEDTLQSLQKKSLSDKMRDNIPHHPGKESSESANQSSSEDNVPEISLTLPSNTDPERPAIPTISRDEPSSSGDSEYNLHPDDLGEDGGEEHVVEVRECPICHQPRLGKRSDADIITHIATCVSQDWRQVDNLVMGGFVTSSQAQRKWYSKVITKISYGGYKLGANSANILVQDRITGQINEERMSVYVRLGIRLLYKGLKSREMEKKRIRKMLKSLSIKQGKKYDDPASAAQIVPFINFHQLDMSEVLLPLNEFKSFNEFFYRALKPGARPCSAPNNPKIVVSPADCRSVVFDRIDEATKIWVKGREFSVERLLGKAYPEDAKRYKNGALGIFRLAPQDYHRFHIPVDGMMGTPKTIEGEYYTVNPMAIRSALDVYGENVRIIVPIDSVEHGRVMVICVGAMMVGSTVITAEGGQKVARGDELGYFKFGGSTLLVLFEPGKIAFDSDLVGNSLGALETLVRVGMSIGHHPDEPEYTPDMRKSEESITAEDRAEAMRRIEGSLNAPSDE